MDPGGGGRLGSGLGTIHSSRSSSSRKGGMAEQHPSDHRTLAPVENADVRLSSSDHDPRRDSSAESMGISDPHMMMNQIGINNSSSSTRNNNQNDFGVSLESLQSNATGSSDASSWLNQYGSMGNVAGGVDGADPWDDEDGATGGGSDGTSMSEISAPRMVTATGGNGS